MATYEFIAEKRVGTMREGYKNFALKEMNIYKAQDAAIFAKGCCDWFGSR